MQGKTIQIIRLLTASKIKLNNQKSTIKLLNILGGTIYAKKKSNNRLTSNASFLQ
jgi:hypothetical protein